MLSQVAIKTAANELLKTATGLKVYGKEVTEGWSTPALFIEIIPKPFRGKLEGFAKSGFAVKITHLQDTPNELEQLQMVDTVKAFDSGGNNLRLHRRKGKYPANIGRF